jgi:hypothetical protein
MRRIVASASDSSLVDDGVRAFALGLGPTLDLGQDVLRLAPHAPVHLREVVVGHGQRAVHVEDDPAQAAPSGGRTHRGRRGGDEKATRRDPRAARDATARSTGELTEARERRQPRAHARVKCGRHAGATWHLKAE